MASQTTTTSTLSSSTLGHEPTTYTPPTSTTESTDASITEPSGSSGTTSTSQVSTTITSPPLSGSSTSSTSTSISTRTDSPSVTSSSSRSLPIGSIIGGLVGALALVLLFVFLVLKHRSSQKKKHSVEADTQATPFGFNFGERLGGYVSVNDGPRSRSRRLSSPSGPSAIAHSSQTSPLTPDSFTNYAYAPNNTNTFSIPPRKFGAHTTGAIHSPTQDEIIHLATMHTSDPNPNQGHFQPYLSDDLFTNSSTREQNTSSTSNPNQSHFQSTFTNASTSNHALDFAPPAYDSLSSISHTNPSRRKS